MPHDQDGPIPPAADRQRVARDQAVLAPRRVAPAQVLLDQRPVAQAPCEALHIGAELRIRAFRGCCPACSTSSPSEERTMTAANSQESDPAATSAMWRAVCGPSPAGSASIGGRRPPPRAHRRAAWRSTRRRPRPPPPPRGGAAPRPSRGSALRRPPPPRGRRRRGSAPHGRSSTGPTMRTGASSSTRTGGLPGLALRSNASPVDCTSTVPAQLAPRPAPPIRRCPRPSRSRTSTSAAPSAVATGPMARRAHHARSEWGVFTTRVWSSHSGRNGLKGPRDGREGVLPGPMRQGACSSQQGAPMHPV